MQYKNEVIIDRPLEKVVALFDDPESLAKWQPGFVSMEHLSGNPGKAGSKSKLTYKMGKRTVEMIETITLRNLPETFQGTYEAKGVWNEVKNYFEPLNENQTRYWTENEFKLKGMMKIMGWIMPGMFKKQSQKYLDLFKEYVENVESSDEVKG